jgi:hypothetical protein
MRKYRLPIAQNLLDHQILWLGNDFLAATLLTTTLRPIRWLSSLLGLLLQNWLLVRVAIMTRSSCSRGSLASLSCRHIIVTRLCLRTTLSYSLLLLSRMVYIRLRCRQFGALSRDSLLMMILWVGGRFGTFPSAALVTVIRWVVVLVPCGGWLLASFRLVCGVFARLLGGGRRSMSWWLVVGRGIFDVANVFF